MINITISKNGLTCLGHADYAEHGKDIVCSAVSALTQAALLGLNRYHTDMNVEHEVGLTKIEVFRPTTITTAILTTLYLGLRSVAQDYQNCVTIRGRM